MSQGTLPLESAARPVPAWVSGPLGKLSVLSIRQPWAWFILHGGKNIENRSRRTNHRGWFLIHASKSDVFSETASALYFAHNTCKIPRSKLPVLDDLVRGGIVGMAKLGNCASFHESPWFVGPWGYVLDEVQPLEFYACAGRLGLFPLPLPLQS